ncbi:MAG TPA: polysaccharide deacetylase family protein, partial [Flavisolibacter sp.]|nr:polysaccharide deacetylase family protein [Flavisolibacter sp.]
MRYLSFAFVAFLLFQSCNADTGNEKPSEQNDSLTTQSKVSGATDTSAATTAIADAATILSKKEVPVLCYHDIRDLRPGESQRLKEYIVGESNFIEQMQSLKDSGYQTISLDDYYDYLTIGKALPAKPIIVSFDDTDLEQYTVGARELEKHGFRGTYFIMTISIGRPRYMSSEQIRDLADKGHSIATHTWDHHKVTKYTEEDWDKQITS